MKIYMKIIWNIQARIEIYQYTDSFDTRTDTPIISCPIREQQSPPPPITFRKTVPFIERRFPLKSRLSICIKGKHPHPRQLQLGQSFHKSASIPRAHRRAQDRRVCLIIFLLLVQRAPLPSSLPRVGQRNTTNQLPSVIYIYISRKGHEGGEVARHAKRNGRRGS